MLGRNALHLAHRKDLWAPLDFLEEWTSPSPLPAYLPVKCTTVGFVIMVGVGVSIYAS